MKHTKEFLLRTIGSHMGRIATCNTTTQLKETIEELKRDIDFITNRQ
jgi:hypothetical protein